MSVIDVTAELLRDWPLPRVFGDTDKDARGRVLVVGGGLQVPGAVLLAATAALRAGAGKLQIAAPAACATALAVAMPEARVVGLPQTPAGEIDPEGAGILEDAVSRSDAVVIGPGLLDEAVAGELALRLLRDGGPAMVVDAAAMPAIARSPDRARPGQGRLILTPHRGEMAGLTGQPKSDVAADPLAFARRLASEIQAVIALKADETCIVSPAGQGWRNVNACPGLATSGSGDVLAGIMGGLLARGAAPAQAAAWGCFVHGACGRRLARRIGPIGFLARELLDEIPRVLQELER